MDSKKILNGCNSWDREDKDYVKEFENTNKKFKETARNEKKEVRAVSKEAQKRVKDSATEIKDWSKEELSKVKDRRKTYGESVAGELDNAKEAKEMIANRADNEAWSMQDRIEGREIRFEEGLDRIEKDVTTHHGRHQSNTSNMDIHGNYMAANESGTVNNYMDQMEEHAENTKKRILDDADDAHGQMKRTASRIQNKK